jgi:hypothetical protein
MGIANQVAGRLHVSASTRDVIRACRAALKPTSRARAWRKLRHQFYRDALVAHRENQDLYNYVMTGI